MKKIVLLSFVLLFYFSSKAQPSISLVTGLHRATVTPGFLVYPDTLPQSGTQKIGFALGMQAGIPLTKPLSLQTGVIYTSKGSEWTQYYDTSMLYYRTQNVSGEEKIKTYSVTTNLRLQYLNVPLNLQYRLPLKGAASLVVGGGPEAVIFFNGNIQSQTVSVSQDSLLARRVRTYFKTTENNDLLVGKEEAQFRIVHFAANAFAGIEFRRVFFCIHYGRDLNEFYSEKKRAFKQSTVGVRFGIYLNAQPHQSGEKKGPHQKN